MTSRIEASADVDESVTVGDGSVIWHLAQIREQASLGNRCVVGRGAYIGSGIRVGNFVKIQNFAQIYEPAVLETGVFVGPAVVLTNDLYPRAVNPDATPKDGADWNPVGVTVRAGASIGARAVCVAPLTIGRWALVAAGSVVTRDVPDYALVAGSPARRRAWVGRAGVPLQPTGDGRWTCSQTGDTFTESTDGELLSPGGESESC